MFDTRVRRHPVQTFQFWFVVLTSFVGVTVWKLDLIAFPRPIPEMTQEEPMPPPPGGGATAVLEVVEAPLPVTAPLSASSSDSPPASFPDSPSATLQAAQAPPDSGPVMSPIARQLASQPEALSARSSSLLAQQKAEDRPLVPMAAPKQQEDAGPESAAVVTASAETAGAPERPVNPESQRPAIDLAEVDRLVQQGEEVAAQRLMSGWYWKLPETRPQLMDRLNVLARRIYFQHDIHYMDPHAVRFGDTMEALAETYQVTPEYLMRLNQRESSTLKVGQVLKVIQGPFSAVVDVSDLEMTVHAQGYFVVRFPIGFGSEQPIPQGLLRVREKQALPGAVNGFRPAGRAAPRECRLVLNQESGTQSDYCIQATHDRARLGQTAGPGDLLLGESELEAVYDLLNVGSEVVIQP